MRRWLIALMLCLITARIFADDRESAKWWLDRALHEAPQAEQQAESVLYQLIAPYEALDDQHGLAQTYELMAKLASDPETAERYRLKQVFLQTQDSPLEKAQAMIASAPADQQAAAQVMAVELLLDRGNVDAASKLLEELETGEARVGLTVGVVSTLLCAGRIDDAMTLAMQLQPRQISGTRIGDPNLFRKLAYAMALEKKIEPMEHALSLYTATSTRSRREQSAAAMFAAEAELYALAGQDEQYQEKIGQAIVAMLDMKPQERPWRSVAFALAAGDQLKLTFELIDSLESARQDRRSLYEMAAHVQIDVGRPEAAADTIERLASLGEIPFHALDLLQDEAVQAEQFALADEIMQRMGPATTRPSPIESHSPYGRLIASAHRAGDAQRVEQLLDKLPDPSSPDLPHRGAPDVMLAARIFAERGDKEKAGALLGHIADRLRATNRYPAEPSLEVLRAQLAIDDLDGAVGTVRDLLPSRAEMVIPALVKGSRQDAARELVNHLLALAQQEPPPGVKARRVWYADVAAAAAAAGDLESFDKYLPLAHQQAQEFEDPQPWRRLARAYKAAGRMKELAQWIDARPSAAERAKIDLLIAAELRELVDPELRQRPDPCANMPLRLRRRFD